MESKNLARQAARWGVSLTCLPVLLLFSAGATASAQDYDQLPPGTSPPPQAATQILAPNQLDALVGPIALYPDPLLGQVLAASTYPLELVEAQQWLQQYGNLRGQELVDAAKQQNWDPSVQALVVFPDVLRTLNRDVRWTTDLGNAFLAQEKDVMDAVQRMRLRAQQNGRLAPSSQQNIRYETENGQRAMVIEPADPQVIYVPVYSPEYVWGPPAYYGYRDMWYPGFAGGFAFGPGIYLGGFFPSWGYGWSGWNAGWGWGCGWFGGGLFVNRPFFSHYGYRGYYDGGRFLAGGRGYWQHDPYHRSGISYADRGVASRFNNSRFAAGRYNGMYSSGGRGFSGSSAPSSRGFAASPRGGYNGGGQSQSYGGRNYSAPANNAGQSYRGNSGSTFNGSSRSYSAPQNYSGGSRGYSAPQNYGGASRSYSAPSSSGFSRGNSSSFSGNARPSTSGGRGFSGGSSPSFSGRSSSGGGGGRSFSGGGGGSHSSGGGGHSSGGHSGGHR